MSGRLAEGVLGHVRRAALRAGGGVTDGQLLGEFLSRRDEAAFECLVRRHGSMVLGICRRVLGHEQDAEDAFQATFLVLAKKAATIRPRERLGNWLCGVANRTALEARRLAARRRAREKQVPALTHPSVEPEDPGQDWRSVLDEEVGRLPDKFRLPLDLCDAEGRTRKEVARRLGLPEGTLSNRLAAARRVLAGRLTRRGLTLSGAALAVALSRAGAPAGVPAGLVAPTIRAATTCAAGSAVDPAAHARVVALTQGVLKAMFFDKVKAGTAVILAVAVGGLVLGGLTYQLRAAGQPA